LSSSRGPIAARFAGFLLLVVLSACDGEADSGLPTETIRLGGEELTVEIAATPEARRQGLMNRESLAADRGMLFVFEDSDYRSFWMKDTSIPLSLAYIDEDGTILEIHELEPFSREPVGSQNRVKFALEVNRGTFERLGVGPGDQLLLPATLPTDGDTQG
jgi:hypothetical protein